MKKYGGVTEEQSHSEVSQSRQEDNFQLTVGAAQQDMQLKQLLDVPATQQPAAAAQDNSVVEKMSEMSGIGAISEIEFA